ncbi:MAG: hypothetical protein FWH27_08270 [Planctomycetaceae bacterium]|nr:hypothetical protein [Planctomycetaceae bacterium]
MFEAMDTHEEIEDMAKIDEDIEMKRREILETMEGKEEAEQALFKLDEEYNKRARKVFFGIDLDDDVDFETWQESFSENLPPIKEEGDYKIIDNHEYNHKEFITPYLNWKDKDVEDIEGYGCNLKEGLFESIGGNEYSYSAWYGRFTKDENGEWVAEIMSREYGDRMP